MTFEQFQAGFTILGGVFWIGIMLPISLRQDRRQAKKTRDLFQEVRELKRQYYKIQRPQIP